MRLRDSLLPPQPTSRPRFGGGEIREIGYLDMRQPRSMQTARQMIQPRDEADPNLPPGCSGSDEMCPVHGIRSPAPEHHTHVADNNKPDPFGIMGLYQSDEDRNTAALANVAAVANAQVEQAQLAEQAAQAQQLAAAVQNDPAAAAEILRGLADMAEQEAYNRAGGQ
jgi:hypothetical protein